MEKNRPKEMQDIYEKHLEEVEESIKDIWENREKLLIDLKIIKKWHVKDWKTRTNDSIAKSLLQQFKNMGFLSNEAHIFSQLLIEDVSYYSKILENKWYIKSTSISHQPMMQHNL